MSTFSKKKFGPVNLVLNLIFCNISDFFTYSQFFNLNFLFQSSILYFVGNQTRCNQVVLDPAIQLATPPFLSYVFTDSEIFIQKKAYSVVRSRTIFLEKISQIRLLWIWIKSFQGMDKVILKIIQISFTGGNPFEDTRILLPIASHHFLSILGLKF